MFRIDRQQCNFMTSLLQPSTPVFLNPSQAASGQTLTILQLSQPNPRYAQRDLQFSS